MMLILSGRHGQPSKPSASPAARCPAVSASPGAYGQAAISLPGRG